MEVLVLLYMRGSGIIVRTVYVHGARDCGEQRYNLMYYYQTL